MDVILKTTFSNFLFVADNSILIQISVMPLPFKSNPSLIPILFSAKKATSYRLNSLVYWQNAVSLSLVNLTIQLHVPFIYKIQNCLFQYQQQLCHRRMSDHHQPRFCSKQDLLYATFPHLFCETLHLPNHIIRNGRPKNFARLCGTSAVNNTLLVTQTHITDYQHHVISHCLFD